MNTNFLLARKLKDTIKAHPQIYDKVMPLWNRFLNKEHDYQNYFESFSKSKNHQLNFIQIGANDGLNNDPLREFIIKYNWNGILIEPHPYVFSELLKNYKYLKSKNLYFENVAISTSFDLTYLDFYTYNEDYLNQLDFYTKNAYLRKSSFNLNHLKKFIKEDEYKYIEKIQVKALSLDQIVMKYNLEDKIDLLVMDTEGFDGEIILSLDFNKFKPELIYFEIEHLGVLLKERVYNYLESHGYSLLFVSNSAFAILKTNS